MPKILRAAPLIPHSSKGEKTCSEYLIAKEANLRESAIRMYSIFRRFKDEKPSFILREQRKMRISAHLSAPNLFICRTKCASFSLFALALLVQPSNMNKGVRRKSRPSLLFLPSPLPGIPPIIKVDPRKIPPLPSPCRQREGCCCRPCFEVTQSLGSKTRKRHCIALYVQTSVRSSVACCELSARSR